MENAFFIMKLSFLWSFLTVVSLDQLSAIMVHLTGFGRPIVSKHLVCCCKASSFSWLSQVSWTTILTVRSRSQALLFLDHLRSAWLANDVWLTWTHAKSHLLSVDIRNRFIEPLGYKSWCRVGQSLKWQWWRRYELMYAIFCSCAVYEYIEGRINFSLSSFI